MEIGTFFKHKKYRRLAWLFCTAFYSLPFILLATLNINGHGEYSFRSGLFSATIDTFYLACCLLQNFAINHISIVFIAFLHSLNMRFAALNSFLRYFMLNWILKFGLEYEFLFKFIWIEIDFYVDTIWNGSVTSIKRIPLVLLNSLDVTIVVWPVLRINWTPAIRFRFFFWRKKRKEYIDHGLSKGLMDKNLFKLSFRLWYSPG